MRPGALSPGVRPTDGAQEGGMDTIIDGYALTTATAWVAMALAEQGEQWPPAGMTEGEAREFVADVNLWNEAVLGVPSRLQLEVESAPARTWVAALIRWITRQALRPGFAS